MLRARPVACEFSGEIERWKRGRSCCGRRTGMLRASEVGRRATRSRFIYKSASARSLLSRSHSPSSSPLPGGGGLHLLSRAISSYVSLFLHATSCRCRSPSHVVGRGVRSRISSLQYPSPTLVECAKDLYNAHLINRFLSSNED